MKELGSITTHTIPYNPQSNPVECSHRSINEKIRISLEERNESYWLDYLPNVLLAIRTIQSTVTGISLYFSTFGHQPILAIDLLCQPGLKKPNPTPASQEEETIEPLTRSVNMITNQLNLLKQAQELSRNWIQARHDQNQKQLSRKCQKPIFFKEGEKVDLWRPYYIKNPLASQRFARNWSGPYVVIKHDIEKPHLVTIKFGTKGDSRNVFVNHLRWHGRKPTGLWNKLPTGFHPCTPPLQNKRDFNMLNQLKDLPKETRAAELANPDVLEEINAPNPGFEIGLKEFSKNYVGQFKTFYDWSLKRYQDKDSETESYYLPR